MRIGLTTFSGQNNRASAHSVRGSGFYVQHLRTALQRYFPNNQYYTINKEENVPSNVDIVHYPYFEPYFFSLPFKKTKKTVVTVHDLIPLVFPKYFPSGIKGKLRWEWQKKLLKKQDAIITDSESSKKDICRIVGMPEEKISVIYLAAGEEFRPVTQKSLLNTARKKYNLPQKFVLYVGDATWNKNLPRLVNAIQKTKYPLVMVGKALANKDIDKTNPWNKDLLEVQNLSIKSNKQIFRLGFVSSEDLVAIYSLATIFIIPSLYEGFGLPALEAMACGCPVLASHAGSLAEVVSDAAFVIDPYSIESIAKGIKEVFEDKEIQKKLSQKGKLQSEKFSWEKTAEKTIRVYNSITHYNQSE